VKEDAGERAGVLQQKAQTIRYLVDAGYKPDTVIEAVEAEDFSLLEHSGLFSVQLQAANAPKQGLFSGTPVPNTEPGAPPAAQTHRRTATGTLRLDRRTSVTTTIDFDALQVSEGPKVTLLGNQNVGGGLVGDPTSQTFRRSRLFLWTPRCNARRLGRRRRR
jgi:hypothetical protein